MSQTSVKILNDLTVTFHRTCRVPQKDGELSRLPADLGHFPIYPVAPYKGRVPEHWHDSAFFIPMYPQEAMWLSFQHHGEPRALQVAAGMVNAVTGQQLQLKLDGGVGRVQNYLAVPPQPWLDGFKPTADGQVRQFVAAQMGSGQTAEEQILGAPIFGGIQIMLFRPKVPLLVLSRPHASNDHLGDFNDFNFYGIMPLKCHSGFGHSPQYGSTLNAHHFREESRPSSRVRDMGLGAGGTIEQKIYPDPYLDGQPVAEVWEEKPAEQLWVYIVHANDWQSLTGEAPPPSPVTRKIYAKLGYPWFGLADGSWGDVVGSTAVDNLNPVDDSQV